MLSASAEAALLKTLEESPEHVVFVLATTDPLKVAPTIRSRTQHYEFTLYSVDEIQGHLADVCAKEGVEADPDALAIIARAGAGSMRDALSLLDQAIAHGKVDVEQVGDLFGGTAFAGRLADPERGGRRERCRRTRRARRAVRRRERTSTPHRRPARDRSRRIPAALGQGTGARRRARRRSWRAGRRSAKRWVPRCWCERSRRWAKRWSTCAVPTRPIRGWCSRSHWSAWPDERPGRRCRRWPSGSNGSNGRRARRLRRLQRCRQPIAPRPVADASASSPPRSCRPLRRCSVPSRARARVRTGPGSGAARSPAGTNVRAGLRAGRPRRHRRRRRRVGRDPARAPAGDPGGSPRSAAAGGR